MNRKIRSFLIILLIIFFVQIVYKFVRSGNNINKSSEDIVEYILNISSYDAKLELTVNSNKTINKYILEQYYKEPNYSKQIVREPESLKDLEIIYNGESLEIKNTNLGSSKIYDNYKYLNANIVWLNFFINSCNNNKYIVEENEQEIILSNNMEKYIGKLYINKDTSLPVKIEIKDNNNQNKIYIVYKEIKLNNIQENNIFAFILKSNKEEV